MSEQDPIAARSQPIAGANGSAIAAGAPDCPEVGPESGRHWKPRKARLYVSGVILMLLFAPMMRACLTEGDAASADAREQLVEPGPSRDVAVPTPPPWPQVDGRYDPDHSFSGVAADESGRRSADESRTPDDVAVFDLTGEELREFLQLYGERMGLPAAPAGTTEAEANEPAVIHAGSTRTVDADPMSTIAVHVRPSSEDATYQTLVVLSEESEIESYVGSFREQDLSIVTRANTLALKLRNPDAHGDVHVVGASGVVYRLVVAAGTDEEYDAIVTVRVAAAPVLGGQSPNRVVELMGAMYRRENPAGTIVYDGAGEILYDRGGMVLSARWVYETATLTGYVLQAQNTRDTALLIERERFTGAGLLLAASEEARLSPGQTTWVYLIFQRGPDE